MLSEGTCRYSCLIINRLHLIHEYKTNVTLLIYCFSPEIVQTMCIYPLQSIASALVYEHCPLHLAPPPHYALPGCIVSRRSHVICCAELKIIFQPEALEWPYVLGERELAPRGGFGGRKEGGRGCRPNKQPPTGSPSNPAEWQREVRNSIAHKKTEASFYTLCTEIPASHSTVDNRN